MKLIKINDINGVWQVFDVDEIHGAFLRGEFTVLGMSLELISLLLYEYERRNGPKTMTRESIVEAFRMKGD